MVNCYVVEHNCELPLELTIRSLFDKNPEAMDILRITILRNGQSASPLSAESFYKEHGIIVRNSGYELHTAYITHGYVLADAMLQEPQHEYVMTMDPDLYFQETGDLQRAMDALKSGSTEAVTYASLQYPYRRRLHPGFSLLKCDPFLQLVKEHGLQGRRIKGMYYDTMDYVSSFLETCYNGYEILPGGPVHFQGVSYRSLHPRKTEMENLLEQLRRSTHATKETT